MTKIEKIVRNFIDDNHITCGETVYQCDWVIENAYKFIEALCEEAGYYKDPDEED